MIIMGAVVFSSPEIIKSFTVYFTMLIFFLSDNYFSFVTFASGVYLRVP